MPKVEIIELTSDNCDAVMQPLLDLHLKITARLEQEMTVLQAQLVRGWRVDLGCTWGGIGARWSALYPWEGGQILGRALCYRAAVLLDEEPGDEPWN